MKIKLKWKPVFSFLCFLSLLFFISALFSVETGGLVVGSFTGFLALFAGILPDHYNNVKGFWFDKILPETHTVLIFIFLVVSSMSIFFFFKNYKLSLNIESK